MHSLSTHEKELLGPAEREKLLEGIFGWGRNPESYFLYKGEGAELYEKILNDPTYRYYGKGMNLIKNNADTLLKYVKKNLTDWGSGTGLKSSLLLQHVDHQVNYIPVDYSHGMLAEARETLSKNKRVNTKEGILITGDSANLVQGLEDNTYFYTGGTMGNFSKWKNIQDFKNMRNTSYFKGNHIIFDYFSAPTQEELDKELKPSYSAPSVKAWFENGLTMLGLSTEDFEFDVEYERDPEFAEGIIQDGQKVFPGSIQCGFRAKRDVNVAGKFPVKQGEFRPILSSKRYADVEIDDILKQSGTKKVRVNVQQEQGMKLVVAKKDPSKFSQHKRKFQIALLLALGVGGGVVGKVAYDASVLRDLNNQSTVFSRDGKKMVGEHAMMYLNQGDAAENTVNYFYDYFETMYNLSLVSADHKTELKLLLSSKLFEADENGVVLASKIGAMQEMGVYEFLLRFTKDYATLLAKRGVPIKTSYPQLAKVAPNFETTLQMSGEISGFVSLIDGKLAPAPGGVTSFYAQTNTLSNALDPNFKGGKNPYYELPDPNCFSITQTLGKYKNSFGAEYWAVEVVRSSIYQECGPFILAVPVSNKNQKSYNVSSVDAQYVIKDYAANFSGQNLPESDRNPPLAKH